ARDDHGRRPPRRGTASHGNTPHHLDARGRRRRARARGAAHPRPLAGGPIVSRRLEGQALIERAARISVLLFDVDGLLTDGGLYIGPDGAEWKRFDIKDGAGLVQARTHGLVTAVLSSRHSAATSLRAAQLGMHPVVLGVADKGAAFASLVAEQRWALESIAYMGDDVLDLPVLAQV